MEKPEYHHLIVAPFDIRDKFMQLIDQEIAYPSTIWKWTYHCQNEFTFR